MAKCGHTAEQHQAEIRRLLFKNQRDLWYKLENIVIAAEPWEPLDPKPAPLPVTTFSGLDDDWTEKDEQDWMNQIRSERHRAQ